LRRQLAIGWTVGTLASAVGLAASYGGDLPTGATMVCTFGLVLILMAAVRPLFRKGGQASASSTRASAA
jgi:zinc/manganese transport system permease protein